MDEMDEMNQDMVLFMGGRGVSLLYIYVRTTREK